MVNKPFSVLLFSVLTAEELLGKEAQRSEVLTSRLQWKPLQLRVVLTAERPQTLTWMVSCHHASA